MNRTIASGRMGFGLLEIMIAMGLLGALSLSVLAMGEVAGRSVKTSKSIGEGSMMSARIQHLLQTPGQCALALKDLQPSIEDPLVMQEKPAHFDADLEASVSQPALSRIVLPLTGQSLISVGQQIESYRVTRMNLRKTGDSRSVSETGRSTSADLQVVLEPISGPQSGLGLTSRTLTFPLWLVTSKENGPQPILDCSAIAPLPQSEVCAAMGPQWKFDGEFCSPTLQAMCAWRGPDWEISAGQCVLTAQAECHRRGKGFVWSNGVCASVPLVRELSVVDGFFAGTFSGGGSGTHTREIALPSAARAVTCATAMVGRQGGFGQILCTHRKVGNRVYIDAICYANGNTGVDGCHHYYFSYSVLY